MSEERDKLRKQVVALVRSLLISTKGGVPLEKLNRDYRSTVGDQIPFRKLNYSSLEEFLDQSPDLCRVAYTNNGIVIHGIATESTAHVLSMVSKQVSKKRPRPNASMQRRPNMQRPWQPPTPSQPFRSQPYQRYHPSGGGPGGHRPSQQPYVNRPGGSGRFSTIQNRSPQQQAQFHQQMQMQQQQRLRTPNNYNNGPIMTNGQSGSGSRAPNNNKPQPQQQQRPSQQQQQQQSPQQPKIKADAMKLLLNYFQQHNLGEPSFTTATMEMKTGGKNSKGKKLTRYVSTVKVGEQRFQTFPQEYPTKEMAEEAAASLALEKLSISSTPISNNLSSATPTCSGDSAAVNNVMAMPIGHFGDVDTTNSNIETKNGSETQGIDHLVDRIVQLVGKRSNGVWSTQIDIEYKREFKSTLPDKWPDRIEDSKVASVRLRVDRPIEGRYIIYPIVINSENSDVLVPKIEAETLVSEQQPSAPRVRPSAPKPKLQQRPPKLVFPAENLLDLYITSIHSTVNVCFRILGDNYSSKFDDMVTNMELKYFENDQVPSSTSANITSKELIVSNAQVGLIYAAKVEGDWHRVEVTNVHGYEVTCYFIDHGDEDVLNVRDLRQLLPEFLQLAPQAKSVRLAGLEDFASDQSAQADLTNAALGRSLVGQVHARDESGIAMILYDTSFSEEDVNINEKILEKFRPNPSPASAANKNGSSTNGEPVSPTPPPPPIDTMSNSSKDSDASILDLMSVDLASLKQLMPTNVPEVGDFFDVNVTLAASPSNFTVQPWSNSSTLENFQGELNSFYLKPKNAYGKTVTTSDITNGDKFYAGQNMDGKWYRVKVNAIIDENTVAAKIVDFGDFTMIPVESLQPLWPQFRNLPLQAVTANLGDIVAINGDWTTEDTVWFSQRVVNNQFVSKIRDVTYDPLDDNVRISLSLIDTTHPTADIYIEKQLVDDKRAVFLCL